MSSPTPEWLLAIQDRYEAFPEGQEDVRDLLAEVERLRNVVADYEQTIPLALRGDLAEHTDDDCAVCNHATQGQVIDAEVGRLRQVIADEVNALRFEWRIEGDVVSREKAKRLAAALNPTEESA